jgi:S1-C subfamily serine protease
VKPTSPGLALAIVSVLTAGCQADPHDELTARSPAAAAVDAPDAPPTVPIRLELPSPPAAVQPGPPTPQPPKGPDFVRVFAEVSSSVVGLAAGALVDGRFQPARTGTAIVWDHAGHIVTNAHLIGGAPRVRIRRQDGLVVRARIVGLDAATDLAVVHAGGLGLKPARRGDSAKVKPGQWVAAIGNPYGMSHSITVGVVSALARTHLPPGAPRFATFIQTDVIAKPGSSGGPLVNTQSEVIALNTAMVGDGLTFSIPVDMVSTVVDRLVSEGQFVRGFAGLFVMRVTHLAAEANGLERPIGARVRAVVAGGPADRAGVAPGDIILRFGEHEIKEAPAFSWLVAATRSGAEVSLELVREGQPVTVTLAVGTAPH